MSHKLNLGLVQMAMDARPEVNRNTAARLVRQAVDMGADMVCLPELFTSPYFCCSAVPTGMKQQMPYAEPIPGPTSAFLQELAKDTGIWLFGGSFHEKALEGFYNTTVVCGPDGSVLGTYRKMHIPHDDFFYEQDFFLPGDKGFQVFNCKAGDAASTNRIAPKVGTLICYDQWFPEAARVNALMGADILVYPTAIGTVEGIEQSEGDWQEAWENVQRGHAIANTLIVAAINRVGKEGDMTFWGGSFICDAFGRTLARGGNGEEVILATVDLSHSKQVREGWRFFYNRRPETYAAICDDLKKK